MSANQTRPLKKRVKSFGAAAIRERRRHDYLVGLVDGADVFDIGCGNDSPDKFRAVRPHPVRGARRRRAHRADQQGPQEGHVRNLGPLRLRDLIWGTKA
jgi:hypothetical protein